MKFCDLGQIPVEQAFTDTTMDKDAIADFLHFKTKVNQNISKCLEQAASKRVNSTRRKHGYFQKYFLERQREKWKRKKFTNTKKMDFLGRSKKKDLSPLSSRPNQKFLLNLPPFLSKSKIAEKEAFSPADDRRYYSSIRSAKYSQPKEFYLNSFLHCNPKSIRKERKVVTGKKYFRIHHPSMDNTFIGRSLKSEGKVPKFLSAKNSVSSDYQEPVLRVPRLRHVL
ncbi:unnamed protein product [Moneuplotes crassus]|uniref:Uncharacterized protein n=1 Tax=Euplotes crassus TaxID=5936 RepID=A0AAD2D2C4_EUPCR|nr:unnamed protein product [Moneuplotes crassus]